MMSKAKFNRLKAEWDKKLAEAGFDDIEYKDGSIRSGALRSTSAKDPILREAAQEYYYMACHFLNEYTFASELERIIWEYHSEGLSVRDICKILKDTKVAQLSRWTTWNTVKRLETIMKSKYLTS